MIIIIANFQKKEDIDQLMIILIADNDHNKIIIINFLVCKLSQFLQIFFQY